MIKRRKSQVVRIGNLKIGGNAPISIQSMTKTETSDIAKTVAEINKLEACGCEIIRVAIKSEKDADAVSAIKRKIKIPLVCDIHFDCKLALAAIANGADKVRLNPGNIKKREDIARVVKAAKKAGIPIRIGVNSGSIGNASPELVKAALGYIKMFEKMDFRDIIISLKSSSVLSTVEAYRKIAPLCGYPLHLGVTAAGAYEQGVIKSAIGIGSLLLDGIGDTIRVSLTADSVEEVIAAKRILSSLNIRRFGPEIISCPTCGRCQVDLLKVVKDLEDRVKGQACLPAGRGSRVKKNITIAVMGCEVNGPGEAREADIGVAAGSGTGALFVKGKIIRQIKEKDFVKELLKELEKI